MGDPLLCLPTTRSALGTRGRAGATHAAHFPLLWHERSWPLGRPTLQHHLPSHPRSLPHQVRPTSQCRLSRLVKSRPCSQRPSSTSTRVATACHPMHRYVLRSRHSSPRLATPVQATQKLRVAVTAPRRVSRLSKVARGAAACIRRSARTSAPARVPRSSATTTSGASFEHRAGTEPESEPFAPRGERNGRFRYRSRARLADAAVHHMLGCQGLDTALTLPELRLRFRRSRKAVQYARPCRFS